MYICRIASLEDMEQKWDYEIALHPGEINWSVWKGEAIERARTGRSVPYYGVLDGRVICEATASPLSAPQGGEEARAERAVELCAFRTVREYRGKGFFSKLMAFMLEDLKKRGYAKAIVGVEPEEKTNREIYRRWGFDEPAGTGTETYPDGKVITVEFCSKRLE